MTPTFDAKGLERAKPWEYAVRFAFGGIVTVAAGLVARKWGPVVGGLFLGFPAILPATLTLVNEYDGRAKAVDDARGGRLGSVGLVAFAAIVWEGAPRWSPAAMLTIAFAAWLAVDVSLWWWSYGRSAER